MTRKMTKLSFPYALMSSTLGTVLVSMTAVWLATDTFRPLDVALTRACQNQPLRLDVRFGSLAAISERGWDVRFAPESGHNVGDRGTPRPSQVGYHFPAFIQPI